MSFFTPEDSNMDLPDEHLNDLDYLNYYNGIHSIYTANSDYFYVDTFNSRINKDKITDNNFSILNLNILNVP